jgi:predicted  nucleic acid-binding Zn-ribbon protein
MAHKTKVHIHDLHFEHVAWLNELEFYQNEINIFQKRLDELSLHNTGDEVNKGISHQQNQIIIQKDQIDQLKHEFGVYEHQLATYAKEHPVAIDHKLFEDHKMLREKMQRFTELYQNFKEEFRRFVGIWL